MGKYEAEFSDPVETEKKKKIDTSAVSRLSNFIDNLKIAGQEGVRTASFGLSDRVDQNLRERFLENPGTLQENKARMNEAAAERPLSAGVGGFAGMLVPSGLVAKGVGMIPKVGRLLRSGGILAGAGGNAIAGGATGALESGTKMATGDEPASVGKLVVDTGKGALGGAAGGAVANALGPAAARITQQLPPSVMDAVRRAADPATLARFGLTGKAAPDAAQLLRMAGDDAAHAYAPKIERIFHKAGEGASDGSFAAKRALDAAQRPAAEAADYVGSFAQRQGVARAERSLAEKAVPKTVMTGGQMGGATTIGPEFNTARQLVVDAARNNASQKALATGPHALAPKYVRQAGELVTDPAQHALAQTRLANKDPNLARAIDKTRVANEFDQMSDALKTGPRELPYQGPPPDLGLVVSPHKWPKVARGLLSGGLDAVNQRGASGVANQLVGDPVATLAKLGIRDPRSAAAALFGYPIADTLLRKTQIMPEMADY